MAHIEEHTRTNLEVIHYGVSSGVITDGVRFRLCDGHEAGENFVVSFSDLERMVAAIRVVRDGK